MGDKMLLSLKRKRSTATSRPPLITPRTFEPRPEYDGRVSRRAPSTPCAPHGPAPSTSGQPRTPFPADMSPELESSERATDDDFDHVVAAIDMKDHGTVGCSYYSMEEETMYLFEDSRSGGMETIQALTLQIRPTVVLTTPRVDLFGAQCQRQNLAQETESSTYLPYQVDVRPSQEFNYSSAQSKLVALDVSSTHEERIRFLVPHSGISGPEEANTEELGFTLQEGRLLYMSSFVDMENPVTIGCAGAIITYLQRRRATRPRLGDSSSCAFKVRALQMFSLRNTMWINSGTFLSLQIAHSEFHPNMFSHGPGKKSSSSKEGLSVYGLFQRFVYTPQGRVKLRQTFFRPSVDLGTIKERHNFIGIFSRSDNLAAVEKMSKSLKHIKNLRPVMVNLRKGISTGSAKITGFKTTVWASLLAFAFYSIDIHDALREVSAADTLAIRTKALRVFDAAQLYRVGRMIQEIVDIDNSEELERTVVNQGLDRDLDRMKDRYDGLNSLLKHVALDIATTIPGELDIDINVIYFPQLGFNIAIPFNDRAEATYNGSDENWELMFVTENRAYFKDFRMRGLDEKLGDIYGLICEKEIEIVYDLAQRVLQYESVLVDASDVCGEIDSLLGLTQAASFYKLTRPQMVQENVIRIKSGRHILQELTVPSYVPNDTLLVSGSAEGGVGSPAGQGPSMLLLTGPNYSGKSAYMKQVALIVYLAQIGSFVPADSAELGITDKILTKINTQESVSKIQSTFMNDLQQISLSLKQVTNRSLVIIDEFGKGTNESDGIGLACGILEHLLCQDGAPKVIATTHFHEIFENNFLEPCPRLQLGHMEVQVCEEYHDIQDQITYLYKCVKIYCSDYSPAGEITKGESSLRPGRSNKSFGALCAAINGIDAAIVSRANEIASLSARGQNLVAACAVLTAEEAQALEEADMLARKFLEVDLSAIEDAHDDVRAVLDRLFEKRA